MAGNKEALAKMLANAEKKYGFPVAPMSEIAGEAEWISTGNVAIDYVCGGGIPLGRVTEISGMPSSGKAQRWTDVVHTPDRGFVQIKDLKIGDSISSPRGGYSELTGIFPQGEKQTYKVTLNDGTSTVATREHLWELEVLIPGVGFKSNVLTTEQISGYLYESTFKMRDNNRLPQYVPVEHLQNSVSNRTQILQELLANSGVVPSENGYVEYTTKSEQLKDDVVELMRSLGMYADIRSEVPEKDSEVYVIRGQFTDYFPSFDSNRKESGVVAEDQLRRSIVSIEPYSVEQCVCISVSHPDKLYFTNDYIVTHNTTTALQAAVTCQEIIKNGGDPALGISAEDKIMFADFENAMDPEYAEALGLDINHESFLFGQPSTLEEGTNFINDAVATGMIRMVIIDSVAAMTPKQKVEGQVGDYHVGVKARLVTDFIEVLSILAAKHNTAVVLLNHTKEKIGMGRPGMPPVRTTPGGVGAKFYASLRLEYDQRKQHKSSVFDPLLGEDVDTVTATDVLVKSIKNKLAPPFRKQVVRVKFGEGFSNFFTSIFTLVGHKKIVYNGGIFYFHRLEEIGGAPDWMARTATGTKRPYIKGEANLFAAAEQDKGWSHLIQALAREVVFSKDPEEVFPEEETEDE